MKNDTRTLKSTPFHQTAATGLNVLPEIGDLMRRKLMIVLMMLGLSIGLGMFSAQNISAQDTDGDGVPDTSDNCRYTPNPEKIAFVSNRDGNYEIYVMNANGTNINRLTNNTAIDNFPSFSPDGSKILFTSYQNGQDGIYVMNADGTNQTLLISGSGFNRPSYSPDGSKIVFSSFNPYGISYFDIYVMNSDGTGETRLTDSPGNDFDPSFSPDGSKIIYISNPGSNSEVYVMNSDGSNKINLTNDPGNAFLPNEYYPSFSPDGSKIVFNSDYKIDVMNSNGTNRINLINNTPTEYDYPSFSPDGSKIVYVSLDGSKIYVMNSNGTGNTVLTNTPFNQNQVPSWGRQADSDGDGVGDACQGLDSTPPVITPTVTGTLGNDGWYTSNVQVSWSVTDGESDVSNQTGCDLQNVTADTNGVTFTCSATSGGGTGSQSVTVKRDDTAPTLAPTVAPNPVDLNASATASPNANDNLSGTASQSCAAVDTSSVGNKTVSCTATDNAGNTANADANYLVIYNFTGFFQPVDNLPSVNLVNAGQSVPMKFSLGGNQGLNILALGFTNSTPISCDANEPGSTVIETVNAGGSILSYTEATDQYSYVWKTDKAWKGTCRMFVLKLSDGTQHYAKFRFK